MEMKPGYKYSDVGLIPEDWSVRSLGEIATIKDGTHQTPKYQASGVPFYSVEHVTSGDFENTKFISEQEHQFLTRSFRIEKGDILMTRIGSIGECKLIDWDVRASFYVSLALLKIKDASAEYIAQYSNSSTFKREIELRSLQHATPKKINLGPISDVKIALPQTEAEQRSIARALSDIDALLAALDQVIAKKRDLKQAAMQQLLTGQTRLPGFHGEWEVKRLGDLATISKGKQLRSSETDSDGYYPHFNGGISPSSFTDNFNTPANTIAISEGGNSCGYVQLVAQPFWCGGHCYAVVPKSTDNRFLFHALKGQQTTIQGLRVGSGLPNVQKTALADFELRHPSSKAEQTAIAKVLTEMDAELATLKQRREKTHALKQAMMQELLTGKTRLVATGESHA